MRISIVTPCFNAEQSIADTIHSILGQRALESEQVELEYIVVDGKSTDGTVAIVEKLLANVKYARIISEKDKGMYDALVKGFKLCTGDVCCYINAGDYYSPFALNLVAHLFKKPSVHWLTGMRILYNHVGQVVHWKVPFRYRSRFFECGMYTHRRLGFLQQESTFWDRNLLQHVDLDRLAHFRYAGDFFLWWTFAQHAKLVIAATHLGGFRQHDNQLSSNANAYMDEIAPLIRHPRISEQLIAAFDRLMWYTNTRIKKRFNSHQLFVYDFRTQQWQ
jgi:glycosyltransferase involved in cell wall biosynthesis